MIHHIQEQQVAQSRAERRSIYSARFQTRQVLFQTRLDSLPNCPCPVCSGRGQNSPPLVTAADQRLKKLKARAA